MPAAYVYDTYDYPLLVVTYPDCYLQSLLARELAALVINLSINLRNCELLVSNR